MKRRPVQPGIRIGSEQLEPGDDPRAAALRRVLAEWPAGVTVVAVRHGGAVHGLTVSAFVPVSLSPPLVLICVAADAPVLARLQEVGRFTVILLAEDQKRVASLHADRFPVSDIRFSGDDDPVLDGAMASLVCRVVAAHPGGDHRIIVGEVERVEPGRGESPLLYQGRDYRTLKGG